MRIPSLVTGRHRESLVQILWLNFTSGELDGVPGEVNALAGAIPQVFEKFEGNNAINTTGLCVSFILLLMQVTMTLVACIIQIYYLTILWVRNLAQVLLTYL